MKSLYERLGGAAAVSAAVDKFYDKVLEDDRINKFFSGIEMAQQRLHQKRFMTLAFGGSSDYAGAALRDAHRRLAEKRGLTDKHFDAVVENLTASLHELGVAPELIGEVATVVESTRAEVLNK